MIIILATAIASWGLTLLALPLLRKYGIQTPRLNDLEGKPVPSGGGLVSLVVVAIGWGLLATNGTFALGGAALGEFSVLLALAFLLAVFFWFDDKHHIKWQWRLGVQGLCVGLGCVGLLGFGTGVGEGLATGLGEGLVEALGTGQLGGGVILVPIVQSFGVDASSGLWGIVDIALAFLCWVAILNFLNFIDGSDGVFASQAILISGGIAVVSAMAGASDFLSYGGGVVAMAILGFAVVNFPPAKVFCGNAGVVALGFLLGGLLLVASAQGMWAECAILVAYVAMDNFFVLAKRFRNKQPLWVGDRSHAYHKFIINNHHSHKQLLFILGGLAVVLLSLAVLSVLTQHLALKLALVAIAYGLSTATVLYLVFADTKKPATIEEEGLITVKTVLISVSDKSQLARIAKTLERFKIQIIASGGTAQALGKMGIGATQVDSITQFPEIFDGRVKTLHPKIHGGILMRRGIDEAQAQQHSIKAIDAVIVDLYPFEKVAATNSSETEVTEHIDVGGPAMLRSAAKNYKHTLAVPSVTHQLALEETLLQHNGKVPLAIRRKFAMDTFNRIAQYDSTIARWFGNFGAEKPTTSFTNLWNEPSFKAKLRYGENPHQAAEVYTTNGETGLANTTPIQGKPLSFNNYQDAQTAMDFATELKTFYPQSTSAVIIKHATPCGVGVAASPLEAWQRALSGDEQSAFGGICAFNSEVDEATATALVAMFLEVIVAPGFSPAALKVLRTKPNLRLLANTNFTPPSVDAKRISGGWLVQHTDKVASYNFECVTKAKPASKEDFHLVWLAAKYARSNAVAIANRGGIVGISGGQTSRVESTRLAIERAGAAASNAVAASDGFFPFSDSVELLAKAGIQTIIQPGGSIKDKQVIAAADKAQLAMCFSNIRHFKH